MRIQELVVVSIPQAVSTVATDRKQFKRLALALKGFNTASGKYCCNNDKGRKFLSWFIYVSIPQAVSTVATRPRTSFKGRNKVVGFNTASGKYCCNFVTPVGHLKADGSKFQYRKR